MARRPDPAETPVAATKKPRWHLLAPPGLRSGRRDLNPRPLAPQASAQLLSVARSSWSRGGTYPRPDGAGELYPTPSQTANSAPVTARQLHHDLTLSP